MIPPGVAVNSRSTSKFSHPDNGGVFQQSASRQVFDQGTHPLIQHGQPVVLQGREYILVIIPATQIDFNKRNTGLDQSPRHQASATEVVFAVPFANFR